MSNKSRKRIYLINRDFQLRYAFAASLVGIVTTVLTSTVIIAPLFSFEILRTTRFLPIPILVGMLVACVANIAIILTLGIFVTHRIAGPMYSLVRSFRTVAQGNYRAIMGVREDDDLKYVVRNFNEMVECIGKNTEADIARLVSIQESAPEQISDELASIIEDMKRRVSPNQQSGGSEAT